VEAKNEDDILAMIAGEDAEPEGEAGDVDAEGASVADDDADFEDAENVTSDEDDPDGEDEDDADDIEDDEDEDDAEPDGEPEGLTLTTSSGREIKLDSQEYIDLPPDAPIRYKVNGEWKTGTYGDLAAEASGQEYIQRKIGETREREAQLAQAAQVVHNERQNFLQWAEQVQQTGFVAPPQMPEWDSNDPIGSMEAKAQYDRNLAAYQQQQQQVQAIQQQQAQYAEAMRQQRLQQQAEKLRETFPELSDPEKAPEFQKRLLTGAQQHYGLSPEDFAGVDDARAIQVLHDAVAYRELKRGRAKARKPREEAQPVTKRSAKPRAQGKAARAKKLKEKAIKTQKQDAWIDLLMTPES